MKGRNRAERRKASFSKRAPDAIVKAVTEFYIEVAQVLDLPRKALPAAPPPPPRLTREEAIAAVRSKSLLSRYREWWLPGLAALLLVVIGGYSWWPEGEPGVPDDFRGTWVTQNASYAGRMIVVSMETVEIVAGRRAATGPLPVTSTRIDTTAEGIRLRVVYGKVGSEQNLELFLHPGRPTTLTLARPADVIWERVEAPVSSADSARTPNR